MADTVHTKFSASAWDRWGNCPGSMVLHTSTPAGASASEGTAKHELLNLVITQRKPALAYLGRIFEADGRSFEVTREFADSVQAAADMILAETEGAELLLSEQRVHYHDWLHVPAGEASGTSDIVALREDTLMVPDYKSGWNPVPNTSGQFRLYALGALSAYSTIADIRKVRLGAIQPSVADEYDPLEMSVDELVKWGTTTARSAAQSVLHAERLHAEIKTAEDQAQWEQTFLVPGEKQCRWCSAAATCPAASREMTTIIGADPAELGEFPATPELAAKHAKAALTTVDTARLGKLFASIPYLEAMIKAVWDKTEALMLAGTPVPGVKLVQGRKGNRQWRSEAEAAELLKGMRLTIEQMYDLKLISPAKAEKLAPKFGKDGKPRPRKDGEPEPLIGPRQWKKLAELVEQAPGKDGIAPEHDAAPAVTLAAVADEFAPVADAPPAQALPTASDPIDPTTLI